MKIPVFSDIHIHRHRQGAVNTNGMNSRLAEGLTTLTTLLKMTDQYEYILFAGDLFHVAPVPHDVANRTLEILKPVASKLIMIAGNHDMHGLEYDSEYDIPYRVLKEWGARLLDGPNSVTVGNVTIGGQHYRRSGVQTKLLPKSDILMLHTMVPGATLENGHKVPHTDEDDKLFQALSAAYKLVIVGHIHTPQSDGSVLIPGAPLYIREGESGDRGFYIIDTKDFRCTFANLHPKSIISLPAEAIPTPSKIAGINVHEWPDDTQVLSEYAQKVGAQIQIGLDYIAKVSGGAVAFSPMIITNVKAENFGSYENFEYTVDARTVAVVGDVEGDQDKSNGAGKSTLFEAISWCLWGKTTKGVSAKGVIRHGANSCSVTVVLTKNGSPFTVTRTRNLSGGQKLSANGCGLVISGTVPAVQQEVTAALGMDFDTFQECSYFSQEQFLLFSRMSNAERKGLFAKILGLDMYDRALDLVKKDVAKSKQTINDIENRIKAVENCLSAYEEQKNHWTTALKDIDADLCAITQTVQKHKEAAAKATNEVAQAETAQKAIDAQITSILEQQQNVADVIDSLQRELAKLQEQRNKMRGTLDVLEAHAKDLSNIGAVCPLCAQPVGDTHKAKIIQEVGEQVLSIKTDAIPIVQAIKQKEAEIEIHKEKLQQIRIAYNRACSDRTQAGMVIRRLAQDAKSAEEIENQAKINEAALLGRKKAYIKDLDLVNISATRAREQLSGLTEMLKTETEHMQQLSLWTTILGPNGFSTVLVDLAAKLLTTAANTILNNIGAGFSILVEVEQKEVVAELSISICRGDDIIEYEALSGGEKQKVDLALMLAMLNMLAKRWKITDGVLGILILDEVISYLDQHSIEVVAEEVKTAPARAIFVITHITELKGLFDHYMVVKKQNGVSRLLPMGKE